MSDNNEGIFTCRNICWIVGALLGLVAFLLILGASVIWGLLVGIVLAVAVALVLQRLFCEGADAAATHAASASAGAAGASGAADTAAGDRAAAAAKTAAAAAAAADKAAAEAAAAEAAEKAASEADAAAAAEAAAAEKAAADAAAVEKAAAEKAAADAAAAQKAAAAADAAATPDYDGDGVREGSGEGRRPEALSAARGGKADDLKMIKGIGPKMEILCNELGFYHYDQIAGWSGDEVAWVDANLKGFKGRVSRDKWVEQAKVLASGAETEFSKRASDDGTYE